MKSPGEWYLCFLGEANMVGVQPAFDSLIRQVRKEQDMGAAAYPNPVDPTPYPKANDDIIAETMRYLNNVIRDFREELEDYTFINAPHTSGPCIRCGAGIAEHTQSKAEPTWFLCPEYEKAASYKCNHCGSKFAHEAVIARRTRQCPACGTGVLGRIEEGL